MRQSNRPNRFLKYVLRINAIFSLTSGILISVFSTSLAQIMGLNSAMAFIYIGPCLCGFALYVWMQASVQKWNHLSMIIFQDLLWVAGSIFLILTNPFDISVVGLWLIAIVAMIVLDLALLQMWRVKRMK